jgi:4,5-dihydroxyphthalate decarboxylase
LPKVDITLAGGYYDRTQALISGEVQPEGINLNYIPLGVDEVFWRALRYKEFEAAEMSLAAYVINRSRGIDDFVGIPVFPSRMFRHSSIYIRADSPVVKPEDLRGARIGLPEYQMTMAVWVRGFLSHIHGVDSAGVTWFTGGVEETGRRERIELRLPKEYKVVRADKPLSEMLICGEIDALISAIMPRAFVEQTGQMKRLFDNYRKAEIEYYQETRTLPIMHLVVIRKDVLERFPWVASSLFKAYNRAAEVALGRMYDTDALPYSLLWLPSYIEEERSILGQELLQVWANGVKANYQCLEMFIAFCEEQGLLENKIRVDDLFPMSLLEHHSFR